MQPIKVYISVTTSWLGGTVFGEMHNRVGEPTIVMMDSSLYVTIALRTHSYT